MDTITVCNAALAKLGEARIFALTDNITAARACKLNFPLALDEVLRSHWWNFAMERARLVQISEAPAFGFSHQYALPAECLRVCEVNGVSSAGDPGAEWEIEGGKLLHNAATVDIRYIKRVSDTNLFDALALEALIELLASKLAPNIQGGSTSKAGELFASFQRVVSAAKAVDSNETRTAGDNQMDKMLAGSRAIAARYGS